MLIDPARKPGRREEVGDRGPQLERRTLSRASHSVHAPVAPLSSRTEVPGHTIVGDSDNAPLEVTLNEALNRTTGLTKERDEELQGAQSPSHPVLGWDTAHRSLRGDNWICRPAKLVDAAHSCVVGRVYRLGRAAPTGEDDDQSPRIDQHVPVDQDLFKISSRKLHDDRGIRGEIAVANPCWEDAPVRDSRPLPAVTTIGKSREVQVKQSLEFGTKRSICRALHLNSAG